MLKRILISVVLVVPGNLALHAQETAQQRVGSEAAPVALSASEISALQKKAESGDASAAFSLGNAYENGNGVRKSSQQAAIWYRKAADQGNAKAENSVGVLYWLGDGVEKDKKQAVDWYRKAARQGNANAMFNLGAAYYNGEGVATVNDTLAYAWFLLSSEAGSSSGQEAAKRSKGEHGPSAFDDACFAIGEMYEKGQALPRNLELAAAWYRKAADHGYVQAQISLATLSINGTDYSEARKWCEAAAKERYSDGYFCLGHLSQHGLGTPQNLKDALKWYAEAAKRGNTRAMQNLGQMYATGEGTKADRPQAFVWFLIAASHGNPAAIADANKLRSSMTEKEWKDSKRSCDSGTWTRKGSTPS